MVEGSFDQVVLFPSPPLCHHQLRLPHCRVGLGEECHVKVVLEADVEEDGCKVDDVGEEGCKVDDVGEGVVITTYGEDAESADVWESEATCTATSERSLDSVREEERIGLDMDPPNAESFFGDCCW